MDNKKETQAGEKENGNTGRRRNRGRKIEKKEKKHDQGMRNWMKTETRKKGEEEKEHEGEEKEIHEDPSQLDRQQGNTSEEGHARLHNATHSSGPSWQLVCLGAVYTRPNKILNRKYV
ncbi:hypothetical protein E2C01_096556 [Portunus trituberculatus]|uniref:Uncharacterized protein n=1 Tax=Portunus trituberculatus TaxID=210409 RepID=A0A5B7K332_PORTR|nr:hypothetical protein [Portunus trituberculatus]